MCVRVSVWMHFRFVIYPGHFVLLLPGSTWGLKGEGGERGRQGARARHNLIVKSITMTHQLRNRWLFLPRKDVW